MSEFEDRERLGELTEPIAAERGELWVPPRTDPGGLSPPLSDSNFNVPPNAPMSGRGNAPPDVSAEAARAGLDAVPGTPPFKGLVDSVFSTRPINARDFMVAGQTFLTTRLPIEPGTFSYTVPNGYIGILRGFRFYPAIPLMWPIVNGIYDNKDGDAITATLINDGFPVPDYDLLKLGESTEFMLDTHVIVNSNKTISLSLAPTEDYQSSIRTAYLNANLWKETYTMHFYVALYGNLLLSRGLPTEFEVMTQVTGRDQSIRG